MSNLIRSARLELKLSLVGALRSLRSVGWHSWRDDSKKNQLDLVFVTPPVGAQGWILDAICKELGSRFSRSSIMYCPFGSALPIARRYFFSHYMYYMGSLSVSSPTLRGRNYVFATHLESQKHRISDRMVARALQVADGVICMNHELTMRLASLGASARKLHTVVGAADSGQYRSHERQADGKIGFCSAFYERKSPDLMLEMVRLLPHRKFLMLGKGWQKYKKFADLCAHENFEYIDTEYRHYPKYYAQMSVFVSASQLEGGPIPLLEAMMSNVVPVASHTGFAPDVIEHGKNGFLFQVGASASEVCRHIEEAYRISSDVSATVQHCNWNEFSARIAAIIDVEQVPSVSNQVP